MKDGVLDPFPLLRAQEGAGVKRRGSPDRVNPLLLVTERKGLSYTLHYAAFPLDAFHTDGEIFARMGVRGGFLYAWGWRVGVHQLRANRLRTFFKHVFHNEPKN